MAASFRPVFNTSADGVTAGALGELTFASLAGTRLVFVNGQFANGLSTVRSLPKGVRAGSLAALLLSDSALLEKHLGRYVRMEDYAFAALNTAFFLDGAFIYVPASVVVPEPIQLVFVSTVKEAGATTHPRNLIVAEKQSQLTVVESYDRTLDASYFTNAVTELVAEDDAVIEHVKVQDESLDAFHIATVDTKPQLEIYADDVKCTHGATVGQLNNEAIFYLRSRGIGLQTAKQMLIHAFAGEIIDRVRCAPVRAELDKLVWIRLEANPCIAEMK